MAMYVAKTLCLNHGSLCSNDKILSPPPLSLSLSLSLALANKVFVSLSHFIVFNNIINGHSGLRTPTQRQKEIDLTNKIYSMHNSLSVTKNILLVASAVKLYLL